MYISGKAECVIEFLNESFRAKNCFDSYKIRGLKIMCTYYEYGKPAFLALKIWYISLVKWNLLKKILGKKKKRHRIMEELWFWKRYKGIN